MSQLYRPPRPVTWITLLLYYLTSLTLSSLDEFKTKIFFLFVAGKVLQNIPCHNVRSLTAATRRQWE
jgi:4-hydroxybenzoate polyprenyltransferase